MECTNEIFDNKQLIIYSIHTLFEWSPNKNSVCYTPIFKSFDEHASGIKSREIKCIFVKNNNNRPKTKHCIYFRVVILTDSNPIFTITIQYKNTFIYINIVLAAAIEWCNQNKTVVFHTSM